MGLTALNIKWDTDMREKRKISELPALFQINQSQNHLKYV